MSGPRYTEGPWIQQPDMDDYRLDVEGASVSTASAVGPDGNRPVAIVTTVGWGNDDEHDANAQLIAAAPRLAEALKRLEGTATVLSNHDRIKQPTRSQSNWGKLHHAIDVARVALREAGIE